MSYAMSYVLAPANLRYGDGSTNSALGETLDPMGDSNENPTIKEQYW